MRIAPSALALLLLTLTLPALAQPVAPPKSEASAASPKPICLMAMGPMEDGYIGPCRRALEALYGAPTKLLDAKPLPKEAYYSKRDRYRAEKILLALNRDYFPGSGCRLIVAMTSVDISTTKGEIHDWGIFGLGEVPGTACVVSIYRLVKKFKGKIPRELAVKRVAKVVTHEVGHTLGLYHCETAKCLMNDAKGTIKTVDAESGSLCDVCKSIIRTLHPDLKVPTGEPDWKWVLDGAK